MHAICPRCRKRIGTEDLNVSCDLALCRMCDRMWHLSALLHVPDITTPELLGRPPGAWYVDDGVERRFGATTRSAQAFILVPLACWWSGLSLGGIYGGQILSGRFDLRMALPGIIFIVGPVLLWALTLMSIGGKVEVTLRGDEGRVFQGIGPIGWTRRFVLSDYSVVTEELASSGRRGSRRLAIVLLGKCRLAFGSLMSDSRRDYIKCILQLMLYARMAGPDSDRRH